MSQQPQHNDSSPSVSSEQDVAASIKRIQQQLISLEKKIDILIAQSQVRPSQDKPFSKPFRSFDRERKFDRPRHFEKRPGEESQGYGYKGKSYDHPRKSDSGQGHHFEKRHSSDKRSFEPKKKPFYFKNKDSHR